MKYDEYNNCLKVVNVQIIFFYLSMVWYKKKCIFQPGEMERSSATLKCTQIKFAKQLKVLQ